MLCKILKEAHNLFESFDERPEIDRVGRPVLMNAHKSTMMKEAEEETGRMLPSRHPVLGKALRTGLETTSCTASSVVDLLEQSSRPSPTFEYVNIVDQIGAEKTLP